MEISASPASRKVHFINTFTVPSAFQIYYSFKSLTKMTAACTGNIVPDDIYVGPPQGTALQQSPEKHKGTLLSQGIVLWRHTSEWTCLQLRKHHLIIIIIIIIDICFIMNFLYVFLNFLNSSHPAGNVSFIHSFFHEFPIQQ